MVLLKEDMRKFFHLGTSEPFLSATSFRVVLFISGIFVGGAFISQNFSHSISIMRANDPDFTYINPLLSCNISENKEFTEYKPLEAKINKILASADPSKVSTASVYYRELNTGRWFGVNENETYSPASLMKVPIMIAYLKVAELDKSILADTIYYGNEKVITSGVEHYESKKQISPGANYTIQSLVEDMIQYSDNAATSLLYGSMDSNSLNDVFTDIGIKLPAGADADSDFMTVKEYAYLFRLLYNSTYLNREYSEEAIHLLTKTDFNAGLRAGVPDGVELAHKFGERSILAGDKSVTERELHDCGIVYYPKHPYLICVMTKGTDFDALSATIKSISSVVYKNMQTTAK
jgi:beta-lactamase class A